MSLGPTGAELREWFRSLATERLQTQLADCERLAERARRVPHRSQWPADYYERRAELMRAVLAERGVTMARKAKDTTVEDMVAFVKRGARAQAVADHLAAYGAGEQFGELEVGEQFHWPPTLATAAERVRTRSRALGPPGAMTKTGPTTYEWSRGTGIAEDYYRVERVRTRSAQSTKEDQ